MKKICLVARQNIINANGGGYHNDEGRRALDGIRYGAVKEIDVLMQEIACTVVDGNEERYQFTWPDKKKSVLLANAPINKTLRPCREESVDFDTTENQC